MKPGILGRKPPRRRPNTKRFTFLLDQDLMRDLVELSYRMRLRSVTEVIHVLLKRGIDQEMGRKQEGE